ncbi:hypothetical protein KR044_008716, partial [Drosophila immigrans]
KVDIWRNLERMENRLRTKMDGYERDIRDLRHQVSMLVTPRDPPFKRIGSKYYYIDNTSRVNWFEAHNRCRKLGAHLVSLQNQDELNSLRIHLRNPRYWTDINELSKSGDFVSSSTGNKPNFILWQSNEPSGNEHCVEINNVRSNYAMNDNSCDQELNFICE